MSIKAVFSINLAIINYRDFQDTNMYFILHVSTLSFRYEASALEKERTHL